MSKQYKAVLRLDKRKYSYFPQTDKIHHKLFHEIEHFINIDIVGKITETHYNSYLMGKVTHSFNPPREWHSKVLERYNLTKIK